MMCPACYLNHTTAKSGVCASCQLAGRTAYLGLSCERCGARFGWGDPDCSEKLCQEARRNLTREEAKT